MNILKQIKHNRALIGGYSPDFCHEKLLQKYPIYSYKDYPREEYRTLIKQKFIEVLGDMPEAFDPICKEESREDKGNYIQIRLIIETEKDCFCPCLLLLPKGIKKPPVVICLQGHSNGMMISVGQYYSLKDKKAFWGDRDFGLHAVEHGYAAMLVEQRGFGERRSKMHLKGTVTCSFLAYNALLVGRTLIGERVWDVSRVIDVLEKRDDVDGTQIGIMGNSGGGTASFYAACFDERIKITMPSCAICTYRESIGAMYHCACNYLPCAGKYFDMGELSVLIYPRPIIVVSGDKDPIFPISGARKCFSIMKEIYGEQKENLVHFIGKGGHRFYADAWNEFDRYMK